MRSVLNMKYAILGLRRLVRSIESHCVTCRKRKASTIQPILSNLAVERLESKQPPFNHTGVDYFGPLYVPVRRSTEKRWGFLFTCITTKAVHLEIVPSLDTSSGRGSLRAVVDQARSGRITARISLVRKRKYLPASRAGMAWLRPFLHTKMLLWNLTRQAHPIMDHGGSWKRLVRSVERVLYDILGSRRVTEEVLGRTLCLVEQALNSRPITPISTDSRELKALTPKHFLLGQHATSFPSLLPGEHFDHKKRYLERSRMLTLFGLVGFANMFHRRISVSSGTLNLTPLLK